MVKVAIDISPLSTGHRLRGIGAYTAGLVEEFKNGNYGLDLEFFENPAKPPPADIIHYPYFDLFFHTLPTKKNSNRVVTIHDVIPLVFPTYFPKGAKGYINLFFQKRALQNTDFVICDSQTSRLDVIEKLSYSQDKIKVIYLAAGKNFKKIDDKATLAKTLQKFTLPRDFAIYVGDVNWNKNLEGLLESVKIAKINLVMVGAALKDSGLEQTKNLVAKINKLGLERRIFMTGLVSEQDLIHLYNLAKVTVLPSFYEGFGLPVLESFSCGMPVVCSNVSSLREIGANLATYCDPQEPSDIAKKIKEAIGFSEQKRELFSRSAIKYASRYTWGKVARQTVEVYKKVTK